MSSHVSDGESSRIIARRVGDEVRAHIGERLKAHYDAVLSEPIPDRFLQLLQSLEVNGSAEADEELMDGAIHEGRRR